VERAGVVAPGVAVALGAAFSSGRRRTTWSRAAIYPPLVPPVRREMGPEVVGM
jgi:hypothetical protein